MCAKHGDEFIAWKCMFCCSEALFVCGEGSFCEHCHEKGRKFEDCKGKNCPLGILHPPPSENAKLSMMPLGCSVCRADRIDKTNVAKRQMRLNAKADKARRALKAE